MRPQAAARADRRPCLPPGRGHLCFLCLPSHAFSDAVRGRRKASAALRPIRLLFVACGAAVGLLQANAAAAPVVKVACFGDSSTHSDQLQQAQEYPAKLQQLLGSAYDVRNFGDCCGTVLRASRYHNTHGSHPFIDPGHELEQSIAFLPDIVVIGGVGKHDVDENGGIGAQNSIVAAEFEEDYEILVQKYLDMPSHPKILVATPIPYPQGKNDPAYIKPMTSIVLPAVKKVALAHQLPLIDLYGTFFDQPPGFFKDDMHLSDQQGLQKEADVVYAAIQASMMPAAGSAGAAAAGTAGAAGAAAGAAGAAAMGGMAALGGGTSGGDSGGASSGGAAAGAPSMVVAMGGGPSGAASANAGGGAGGFAGAAAPPVSSLGSQVAPGASCSTRNPHGDGSPDMALWLLGIAVSLLRQRRSAPHARAARRSARTVDGRRTPRP